MPNYRPPRNKGGFVTRNAEATLDREVKSFIQGRFIDANLEAELEPEALDPDLVYSSIKRSNVRTARQPKVALQRSIQRVIDTHFVEYSMTQLDSDSDTDAEIERRLAEEEDQERRKGVDKSNAMNRRIVNGFEPPVRAPGSPTQSDGPKRRKVDDEPSLQKHLVNPHDTFPLPRSRNSARPEQPSKQQQDAPKRAARDSVRPPTHVSLSDLGGMEHIIKAFKQSLALPLLRPELYLSMGLKIPRGILLHGPPGCGKTMLCEAVASKLELPFLSISAPSIVSGMSGESEKTLRGHFDRALSLSPCLMFIDEIDAVTPKRESAQREMERRIVAQLLTCLDDLALEKTGGKPVIVLAATNRPDSLDPALRRAGRFDTEINIGIPDQKVREKILRAQTRETNVAPDVDFAILAKRTPGFVGADLQSLVSKAGNASISRYLSALEKMSPNEPMRMSDSDNEPIGDIMNGISTGPNPLLGHAMKESQSSTPTAANSRIPDNDEDSSTECSFSALVDLLKSTQQTSPDPMSSGAITMPDFLAALPTVQPSSKREGFTTIPDTTWDMVGALHEVRESLRTAIVKPILYPEMYAHFGISAPAGILLWGPPGCGKTMVAEAVANEAGASFISVKGPELLNKYVGESERQVRTIFSRARDSAPCIIFFDELDALVPKRDAESMSEASARVVNTLLTELDGVGSDKEKRGVHVVAATNRPEMIDPAMLRPGRLGKHIFITLPGEKEREEILATKLKDKPCQAGELAVFARGCVGFSGADLSNLVYEAALKAMKRRVMSIEWRDLEEARKELRPSVGDIQRYERFKGGFNAR